MTSRFPYRRPLVWGVVMLGSAAGATSSAVAGVVDSPTFRAGGLVIVMGGSDFSENGGTALIAGDFLSLQGVPSDTPATDLIAGDLVTTNYNTGRYNASSDGRNANWNMEVTDPTFGGEFQPAGPFQTLGPEDSYTAFGIHGDTDLALDGNGSRASQFLVASNTPFQLRAHATNLVNTGGFSGLDYGNIRFRMNYRVQAADGRHGTNAQVPHSGSPTQPGSQAGFTFPQTGTQRWTLANLSAGPTTVFRSNQRTAARPGNLLSQSISFRSRYQLLGAGVGGANYDLSMGAGELGATVTYTVYSP